MITQKKKKKALQYRREDDNRTEIIKELKEKREIERGREAYLAVTCFAAERSDHMATPSLRDLQSGKRIK
jgi:hypothetical protein